MHTEERVQQWEFLSSFFTSSVLDFVEAGLEHSKASSVIVSAEFEMVHANQNLGQCIPATSVLSL